MATALIKTTAASEIDCTLLAKVSSIEIASTEPTGTSMRYLVKMGSGNWQKYDTTNRAWADVATQTPTAESVLSEGNTKAELTALGTTALAAMAGKVINFAIALSTDGDGEPSISGITINGASGDKLLETYVYSDAVALPDIGSGAVEILDISVNKKEVGQGTVTVLAAIRDADGNWGEYVDYKDLVGRWTNSKAQAIRFKAALKVVTPGTDSATLTGLTMTHRTDDISVVSEGTGVLLTKTYTFSHSISRAHLMLKHPIVPDTEFTAEIAIREAPVTVTDELLGTGDGEPHTVTLAHTKDLASHGFTLYFDGVAQDSSKYAYSSTDGQVTYKALDGVTVTADYIYNWTKEKFVPMTSEGIYTDMDNSSIVSENFDYSALEDDDPAGTTVTVRVNITQLTGRVDGEVLGIGDDTAHSYKLAHHAKSKTIEVAPATATWKYKTDTDYLTVTAPEGEQVSVSYNWAARQNNIDSMVCIFNE